MTGERKKALPTGKVSSAGEDAKKGINASKYKQSTNDYTPFERIKKAVNIMEIAEDEGITLTKRGRTYKALCPFHEERTPSFSISQEKQMYKCFGCGAGGDVITLVAELRGITNKEAAKIIGEKIGLPLQQKLTSEQKKQLQKGREATSKENAFFEACNDLHADLCMIQSVMKERGRTIKKASKISETPLLLHYYQENHNLLQALNELENIEFLSDKNKIEAYKQGKEVYTRWAKSEEITGLQTS